MRLHVIHPDAPPDAFPDPSTALRDPDGLLAIGGDLGEARLVAAYRRGIFPWYGDDQPLLWWSPDPRMVMFPDEFHMSRSLRRKIRRNDFEARFDGDFRAVIDACRQPRPAQGQLGTWITDEMRTAYVSLFESGIAHCVEVLHDGRVIGGIYGLAIGKVFFGESMFSAESDGSKLALHALFHCMRAHDMQLLDCQVHSEHLAGLGARPLPRREFLGLLAQLCDGPATVGHWRHPGNPFGTAR